MTEASLKIEGMDELTKTLTQVSPAEGRRIARRTVTRIARDVRDDVRRRTPVHTGDLKRAIKSRGAKGARGEAAAQVWVDKSGGKTGKGYHWHLVEFGTGPRKTRKGINAGAMPATPFITPTVEEWRSKIPGVYRDHWWGQYEVEMAKRARKGPKVR